MYKNMQVNVKKILWTKLTGFICFLVLSTSVAVYAQESSNTKCLDHRGVIAVKSAIDQIVIELEKVKPQITNNPKIVYKIVNQLLVPKADFKVMSQLVLTRNWKGLSDEQQAAFIKEFERLIVRTYGIAFESYDGETVEYICPIRTLPGASKRVEISTMVHSLNRPDSEVKFRVLESNKACNDCTSKFDSCKKVGDNCKVLQKAKDDAGFTKCKADYDTCRQDVKVCKDACSSCQDCKGSACDQCGSQWLVYDLIIDNISIVDSYRQIFTDKFRKQRDANKIIAEMHDKNCKEKDFCN